MFKFYPKYKWGEQSSSFKELFSRRSEWKEEMKAKYPIQYFFRETIIDEFHFLGFKIKDIYYYLKCLFFRRYHILRLRDDPRWLDSDTKIELALQKILFGFVENEMDIVNWDATPEHKNIKTTLLLCYHFFKEELPCLEKENDELLSQANKEDFKGDWLRRLDSMEKRINDLTEANLIAIIKIRKSMWT